ncbi:esterase/lipase family protein [[Limnothrix rosea] IAM M-220]|uniref:esterase/lipase family protein n=1 Tax=[Limnothrix rosea] IAM M-220 TaxID=454133 RepID=UPI00095A6ABE|nr:alpha/beta fold hydrolase [[Limnothrix rosea] IAM M-220]OKH11421.1 lipase [[Limnothrix rosea] IAM M-220]
MEHGVVNPTNPVVLVHGFLDRQYIFKSMARYLKAQGWSVYALDLVPNDGRQSLPNLARQLQVFIDKNLSGSSNIDLIGFSMGGLVTRYYLQRMGGHERVERYISISAPNNGTLTAYSLPFPGIKQMRPNSDFLNDLNGDVESCLENIQVTWMWTPFDLMILPADSTRLPIGHEVKLPVAFHPWMLSDRQALAAVKKALLES